MPKNMTVGKKLGSGFALIVLLMGIMVWVGIASLTNRDEALDRIVNVNNFREQLANDAGTAQEPSVRQSATCSGR